jgi:hypothetical protein
MALTRKAYGRTDKEATICSAFRKHKNEILKKDQFEAGDAPRIGFGHKKVHLL